MELRSGSRDSGVDKEVDDDDVPAEDQLEIQSQSGEADTEIDTIPIEGTDDEPSHKAGDQSASGRPSMASIPYKLRRNKVNEGREQVPFFLRQEVIDAEGNLQDSLETMLDDTVDKSHYREATMVGRPAKSRIDRRSASRMGVRPQIALLNATTSTRSRAVVVAREQGREAAKDYLGRLHPAAIVEG